MWERGTVKRIVDGDTIYITIDSNIEIKARIIGIDAPEKTESGKLYAQANELNLLAHEVQFLGRLSEIYARHNLSHGKKIEFFVKGIDYYGRSLVWIRGFNFQMVRDGYAFAYESSELKESTLKTLRLLEKEAQGKKIGIWEFLERSKK